MHVHGARVLVLGGAGLVGMAVCRELLGRKPAEIALHSRRPEKAEAARRQLLEAAGDVSLSARSGDIFQLADRTDKQGSLRSQLASLREVPVERFLLHCLICDFSPDIVIDCVNTATAIAYRNVFQPANRVLHQLADDELSEADVESLLDALYIPRLTRHVQVMYQSMIRAGTQLYVKVGTTGTGGMGLNIPYTHSEEKPSRMLLAKTAVAGAHSMLLFLMARTPGAPVTKEIKPAATIGWKAIAHGAIERHGEPIRKVDARPQALGPTISSVDPSAAAVLDENLEAASIDTGENGLFSREEFAAITAGEQMEFITPEEIAQYLVAEIEGRSTGRDVISALDSAVMGPSYRAGVLRQWALQQMQQLELAHGTYSVAFEMLGPPRLSKLLFEAHLIRLAFENMSAARSADPQEMAARLDKLVRTTTDVANQVVAVGIPILLASGEIIRGTQIIVPGAVVDEAVTAEKLESWVHDGWVDLRPANCATWIDRLQRIWGECQEIPETDTSSRFPHNRRCWLGDDRIQPGELAGWILSVEERGTRMKR